MVTSFQRPHTPPSSVVQLLLIKGCSLGTHLSGQGARCSGHSSALAPTPPSGQVSPDSSHGSKEQGLVW